MNGNYEKGRKKTILAEVFYVCVQKFVEFWHRGTYGQKKGDLKRIKKYTRFLEHQFSFLSNAPPMSKRHKTLHAPTKLKHGADELGIS